MSAEIKRRTVEQCTDSILAARQLTDACRPGNKLLLCGNGGSAADSQDFNRPGLPALALTTDTAILTACANDVDFDGVFACQVEHWVNRAMPFGH